MLAAQPGSLQQLLFRPANRTTLTCLSLSNGPLPSQSRPAITHHAATAAPAPDMSSRALEKAGNYASDAHHVWMAGQLWTATSLNMHVGCMPHQQAHLFGVLQTGRLHQDVA